MPNGHSGEGVEHQTTQNNPRSQAVHSPLPPNSPDSQASQRDAEQQIQHDIKDIDGRIKRGERWMIGLTIAIAFFALCAVVVSVLQWNAMTHTLDLTREQVHIGLRAYVIVEPATFGIKPSAGKTIRVEYKIKNTGQTPAQQIQVANSINILSDRTLTGAATLSPALDGLGAGQERTIGQERLNPLTSDEFKEVMNPEELSLTGKTLKITEHPHIYVWGTIVYKDVFGGTGQTDFCMSYVASIGSFIWCNMHNGIK